MVDDLDDPMLPPDGAIDENEMGSRGFRVYIDVTAGGELTVGVENLPEPMGDGMEADPDSQPVENIKEALTLALDLYRARGDTGAMMSSDESFASGFNS